MDGRRRRRRRRRRAATHRLGGRHRVDGLELGHRRFAERVGIGGEPLQRLDRREHALALDRDVGLEPPRVGAQALAQRLEGAHLGAQALPQVFGTLARVALGGLEHLGDLRLGFAHLRSRMVVGLLARAQRVGVGLATSG